MYGFWKYTKNKTLPLHSLYHTEKKKNMVAIFMFYIIELKFTVKNWQLWLTVLYCKKIW